MKIISNYTDFYDSLLQFGYDEKLVYNRICKFNTQSHINFNSNTFEYEKIEQIVLDTNEINLISKIINNKNSKKLSTLFPYTYIIQKGKKIELNNYILYTNIAIINNKPYFSYVLKKNETNEILLKTIDEHKVFNKLKEIGYQNLINNIDKKHYRVSALEKKLQLSSDEFFNKKINNSIFNFYDFNNDNFLNNNIELLHKKYETPLLLITVNTQIVYNKKINCFKNVPLKYFGFSALDAQQIIQELSFCLGNTVLNKNEPPEKISDIIRLEQHGFDKKVSFRKRKENT